MDEEWDEDIVMTEIFDKATAGELDFDDIMAKGMASATHAW